MRIAIFSDAFLPKIDGVVSATVNLAKGLAKRGHKVIIVAPSKKKGQKEAFIHKNVEILRIPSIPAFFYPGFRFTWLYNKKVINYLEKKKIEFIHFQTQFTLGYLAISAAKKLDLPLTGTFHTFISDPEYLRHAHLDYKFVGKMAWK